MKCKINRKTYRYKSRIQIQCDIYKYITRDILPLTKATPTLAQATPAIGTPPFLRGVQTHQVRIEMQYNFLEFLSASKNLLLTQGASSFDAERACQICFEQGISQPKDDGLGVGGLMGQLGSMSLTNEQRKPIAQTDHVPSRGRGNMRGRGA